MKNTKDKISLVYKFLILVITAIGLYLNFKIADPKKMILYFTMISNILVLLFYIYDIYVYIFKDSARSEKYYILKGMTIIMVCMTMIIYWLLIGQNNMGIYTDNKMECRFVHLYIPLLTMFDYILFAKKGNLKYHYAPIWSINIVLYAIFVYTYSFLGGRFINDAKVPYSFMNIDKLGLLKVSALGITIYIMYVIISLLVIKLDKVLGGKNG